MSCPGTTGQYRSEFSRQPNPREIVVTAYLFTTDRVQVRKISNDDFHDMMSVYGDVEAMRWVDNGEPIRIDDCRRWIAVTLENYRQRGYGMFALTSHDDQQVIGFCGLVHPGGQEMPEIKYAFKREFWGRGLASEVVPAMLQFAASKLGRFRVIATIDPDNVASRKVVTRAGMELVETRNDENGLPTLVYEWQAGKPS